MQVQVALKNFGLSEKEIAVYLALIELGSSSVRTISQKAKINRGTTYDILKSLINLGIISYYNKESKQYFIAERPETLLAVIDKKQEELKEVKENIEESLPLFKTIFEKQGGKPVVKLYEGVIGIRHILEDVLKSMDKVKDKTYYVYSSATVRKNVYQAMRDFSNKRIRRKIKVKTIALGEGGNTVGLDERKWMQLSSSKSSKGQEDLRSTYEIIYGGNKVAHISLDNAENPVGVVIENQEIYHTQKLIFEYNWKNL
ncbi:MAG: helix-turn-helix domain-containing protein [Candidatus Pacebacteria bacterium]|nr:helix-turn-helix domain-containing protein [Candidatus Paceibacterota bacterium]